MIYKSRHTILPTALAVIVVIGLAGLVAIAGQERSPAAADAATGDTNLVVDGSALASSTAATALSVDEVLLLTDIQRLNAITFDSSIFSNQVFTSFTDFLPPIVPPPAGRANPFAPLGGVVVTSPSATKTSGH